MQQSLSEAESAVPQNSDFYYPISPQVAYIICDSHRFAPGKNVINESIASELNIKVASQAMVHIIGNSESAIQPFKKHIWRRNQNSPDGLVIF
ncbi:hypothetical protein [Sphaerotilus sp.]|uniref:hypothetical protein n=1 Tax=Sphaerotilus sp. TaxID=2093942 RepID=UPI002ACEF6E5|nr:hypothetical protein [Sphaerotilus sp.]MDZ7855214.1 hypothetical protein [Sphaerotilus sp.]